MKITAFGDKDRPWGKRLTILNGKFENLETLKIHKIFNTLDRAEGFEVSNSKRVYLSRQQFFVGIAQWVIYKGELTLLFSVILNLA